MAKKIGIAVVVVLVVLVGLIATRPATFHIERSAIIAAKPEVTFTFLNNVEKRHDWYPWDELDPAMKRVYTETKEGVGASYTWEGNDKVGKGKQTITASVPNQKVVDDLEFMEPMPMKNVATFTLAPEGDGTKVTWAMDGELGFLGKAASLVMNMDKSVGPDFEKGLKKLNDVASAAQAKATADAAAAASTAPPAPADGAAPPAAGSKG